MENYDYQKAYGRLSVMRARVIAAKTAEGIPPVEGLPALEVTMAEKEPQKVSLARRKAGSKELQS